MTLSSAIIGALVLSDVAGASAPRKPSSEKVVPVEQQVARDTPVESDALGALTDKEPAPMEKSAKKKRGQKKIDFGRFEGY